MVEVYKVIVHNYLKHLVKVRPNKLVKIWGPDIGRVVIYDAEVLHSSISELVRAAAVSLKRPHSTALNILSRFHPPGSWCGTTQPDVAESGRAAGVSVL